MKAAAELVPNEGGVKSRYEEMSHPTTHQQQATRRKETSETSLTRTNKMNLNARCGPRVVTTLTNKETTASPCSSTTDTQHQHNKRGSTDTRNTRTLKNKQHQPEVLMKLSSGAILTNKGEDDEETNPQRGNTEKGKVGPGPEGTKEYSNSRTTEAATRTTLGTIAAKQAQ